MLCKIKDFNSFNSINSLQEYPREQMQQILIVLSTIDYLKSQGELQDLEVIVE